MTDLELAARIGTRLRELRNRAGVTQQWLARRLDPPLDKETISRYERGTLVPSMRQLEGICRLLGTDMAGFWQGEASSIVPPDAPRELVDIVTRLKQVPPKHLRFVRRIIRAHLEAVEEGPLGKDE